MATLIQRQLIPPPILAFLLLDVLSDNPLIAPHRRDEIAAGPEVLSHEVTRAARELPSDVDRTFALEIADPPAGSTRCFSIPSSTDVDAAAGRELLQASPTELGTEARAANAY